MPIHRGCDLNRPRARVSGGAECFSTGIVCKQSHPNTLAPHLSPRRVEANSGYPIRHQRGDNHRGLCDIPTTKSCSPCTRQLLALLVHSTYTSSVLKTTGFGNHVDLQPLLKDVKHSLLYSLFFHFSTFIPKHFPFHACCGLAPKSVLNVNQNIIQKIIQAINIIFTWVLLTPGGEMCLAISFLLTKAHQCQGLFYCTNM